MNRLLLVLLILAIPLSVAATDQYGAAAYRQLKFLLTDLSCSAPGTCDLAAGTTVGGAAIGGGSGEVNTASNIGGGLANWHDKNVFDLRFNTFSSADFDLNSNLFTIDSTKWLTIVAAAAAYQPLDTDLTNIAALSTTTGGRSILGTTPADDQIYVGDSASAGTWRSIPDCGEAGTLNYTASTNSFSCLTDGGGGGGGNGVDVTVALGTLGWLFSTTTVTGQAWVSAGSKITCGGKNTGYSALTVSVGNIVAGVGFDVYVRNEDGLTGNQTVSCIGV